MPQLDSSAFWGIVGIIVGIIVATFFHIIGKKRTLLQYDISTTRLVTKKMAVILNGRMSIDGQPVASLSSTTIRFINLGNQPIKSSDFSEQEPLRIILKGHLYGHDVSLGNQKLLPKIETVDGTVDETVNETADEKVLNISFGNLKPRQFFAVTILHDKSLSVSGELTSGDMKKFHSKEPMMTAIMVPLVMVFLMFVSALMLDELFNGHIIENMVMSFFGRAFLVVMLVLICVGLGFSYVLLFKESFLYPNRRKILEKEIEEELQNLKKS